MSSNNATNATNGYNVRLISQIDNKSIKLGKTFKYGDNYHLTNIYYVDSGGETNLRENEGKRQDAVDEKTKLIIQTPLMYIPNSIIYLNEKPFLELSFSNEENDKEIQEFRQWITTLEEHIFKLIKRRTTLGITSAAMSSILKPGYHNSSMKLLVPINLNISKCLLTDDNKRNKILFNWDIPVPTYGMSIIWIKNIWVKKGKWGLNLFMYASRVMNSHILDPITFMGHSGDNKSIRTVDVINKFHKDEKMEIQIGAVPEYSTFFRMLKMGIPKDAIKQKMTMSCIDGRIIDYPESAPYITVLHYINHPEIGPYVIGNSSPPIAPPPPPPPFCMGIPPPPPPLPGQSGGNLVMAGLLSEINKGGFKLKKVDPKEQMLNKIQAQSGQPSGMKVPSLSDIQGALARLRRVDLD